MEFLLMIIKKKEDSQLLIDFKHNSLIIINNLGEIIHKYPKQIQNNLLTWIDQIFESLLYTIFQDKNVTIC